MPFEILFGTEAIMSNMIERVARALFVDAAGDEPTVGPDDLTATGLPGWRLYEDAARAAIAAMHEPTEAWQAMIDAALGE
jgi:hypothetical protein